MMYNNKIQPECDIDTSIMLLKCKISTFSKMRDFCIIVGRGCITELSSIICNPSYLIILWLFKCNVTTVSCFKYYKN